MENGKASLECSKQELLDLYGLMLHAERTGYSLGGALRKKVENGLYEIASVDELEKVHDFIERKGIRHGCQ